MARRIIYTPEFDDDCRRIANISAIQRVIAPLIEILERGQDIGLLDTGTGLRFVSIKAVEGLPALHVSYLIDEDGDAIMVSIDIRHNHY